MADVRAHPQPSLARDVGMLVAKIALVVVAALVLFTFVFGLHRVADPGMEPNMRDGDLVMFYRLDRSFHAGDVAVFEYGGSMLEARVIAVAGDEVSIDSRGLLVNGAYQQERNIYEETTQVADGVTFPLVVPDGKVFLLGDNRTEAVDSRIFGCVSESELCGKVMGQFRRRGF